MCISFLSNDCSVNLPLQHFRWSSEAGPGMTLFGPFDTCGLRQWNPTAADSWNSSWYSPELCQSPLPPSSQHCWSFQALWSHPSRRVGVMFRELCLPYGTYTTLPQEYSAGWCRKSLALSNWPTHKPVGVFQNNLAKSPTTQANWTLSLAQHLCCVNPCNMADNWRESQ